MTEPKTGLEVGVWFEDSACLGYRGTLSVVIQFQKTTPEHMTEPMLVSRCPPCEVSSFPSRKIKRWMILPP